jgi:thiol peroxidase
MIYKILFATIFICFNTIELAHSTAIFKNPEDSPKREHSQVKIADKVVKLSADQQFTGDKAPNFKVVDEQFNPVQLNDFIGQTVLISVVPSIDTGTCSLQTKRFNDEVLNLPANVTILTISTDLPFAQKRFCSTEKIEQLRLLSDAVWRDFGLKYGLLIEDMGLLARAILIIDGQGIIRYQQVVEQIAKQPDYEDALKALNKLSLTDQSVADQSAHNEQAQSN